MRDLRFPWVSAAIAALCLAVAWVPGGGEALQYERARVAQGQVWLLLSGQLTHWSVRMAWMDLGVLLGLAAWLEAGGRRREMAFALGLGAVATAGAVQLSPDLLVYRGSSGLASALFVLAALGIARSSRGATRGLALLATGLFLAKAAWECRTGQALFAGPLAPGVRVVPMVHLLAGLAGAAATRQMVFPTSSATSKAPRLSIATPTGRPRASPRSLTKPLSTPRRPAGRTS